MINDLWHSEYRNVKLIVLLVDFQMKSRNKECFLLSLHRNMDKCIIMGATVNNTQANGMATVKAVVVRETTYQKLKRLSKKYRLQTNDPKFARV